MENKKIPVYFENGPARDEARFGENAGVTYMLAIIDEEDRKEDLYIEVEAAGEDPSDLDNAIIEEMRQGIIEQAKAAGISEDMLIFDL